MSPDHRDTITHDFPPMPSSFVGKHSPSLAESFFASFGRGIWGLRRCGRRHTSATGVLRQVNPKAGRHG